MKKLMTIMFVNKRTILRVILFDLIVAFISVLLAALLCWVFGDGLVKYTADANKLSYISRYYNITNQAQTGSVLVEGITVISCHEENVTDSLQRKLVADVVARCGKLNPRVIGIDIRFNGHHNKSEDEYLKKTMLDNRDKIVLSRSYFKEEKRSFFDTDNAGFSFGYANLGNFYDQASSVEPSLAKVILEKADMLDTLFSFNHNILDFTSIGIEPLDAKQFLKLSDARAREEVDGRIVIVGDADDEKDVISLPFLVNGKEWMEGVAYHVYCINSMREGGARFREYPFLNLILCLVLTFLYVLLSDLFRIIIKKKMSGSQQRYRFTLFLKPIVMAIVWALIPICLMGVFTIWFRVAPNIVMAMLSVSMILFFDNYINELKNSWS